MEKRYYIAYGSNLNIPQMRTRCPGARIIGTSVLEGWRLLFRGSRTGSYLTIERQEGARVPVAAWEVSAENEAALDRYEGFPTFYYKKEMELTLKGIRSGKLRRRRGRGGISGRVENGRRLLPGDEPGKRMHRPLYRAGVQREAFPPPEQQGEPLPRIREADVPQQG